MITDKTILIVEDDFLNRRFYRSILWENGYRIIESKSTSSAIQLLNTENVDLVILDIHLGEDDCDGISLGEKIKQTYKLPFLYITAAEDPEVINRALITGPNMYLTKPFKNVDLITSIEIAVRQSFEQSVQENEGSIVVKDGAYNTRISYNNIEYIEAHGNYILIYINNNQYKYRSTIKQIMDMLPENFFIQTHRAFIVNKNKIEKFNTNNVIVNNNIIPVSRNFYNKLELVVHNNSKINR